MKYLVKYMITGLLALLPAGIAAQNTALLQKLYDGFASHCIAMDCEYAVVTDGISSKGECKVEVQGICYRMQGSGLDIFCDGESVWVMDSMAKEAIVEPATGDSFSYMSNPALLFRDMDKVFTVVSSAPAGSCVKYQLSACESCGIDKATLEIDNNAVLKTAGFTMDDGSVMTIKVLSMTSQPLKAKDYFYPFDISAEWIVTDLR